MEYQKRLFLVLYVIQCYHSNEFVREYLRFSKVIVPSVSLQQKFNSFQNVRSDLIFIASTPKYFLIANFSQIREGAWELRASKILAYASAKIQVMTS